MITVILHGAPTPAGEAQGSLAPKKASMIYLGICMLGRKPKESTWHKISCMHETSPKKLPKLRLAVLKSRQWRSQWISNEGLK